MKCPFCTTPLPVDGNTPNIVCPKCGSPFTLEEAKLFDDSKARMLWFEEFMIQYDYEHPISSRLQSSESC